MSAATVTTTPAGLTNPASTSKVTFGHLVRSEWIKLWTLRSTWWVVPLTIAAQSGLTWLVTYLNLSNFDLEADFGMSAREVAPTMLSTGVMIGQLVICVLATLAITGEYSTGSIRSTLAAAPRRTNMLAAKALVILTVAFITGVVTTVLSWALTAPSLGTTYGLDLSDPIHTRVLLGIPLYLAGIALFAYAIGALLRHSAAALATVFGVLLVVEMLLSSIRGVRFLEIIAPFTPSNAGAQLLSSSTESIESLRAASDVAVLTPWQGFGVLLAWGVVLYITAAVLLRRRDA